MDGRINFRVPEEELKAWKHTAIDEGITLSEMVRRAMKLYLEQLEADRKKDKKPKG